MAEDKDFTGSLRTFRSSPGAMLGLGYCQQVAFCFSSLELGGSRRICSLDLDPKAERGGGCKKGVHHTRIGDMGLSSECCGFMAGAARSLLYDGNGCLESASLAILGASATFIALLIFCGAAGNRANSHCMSGYRPMEGPTPVSALIHAATMVAAGVFLVARVYPVFSLGAINA